MALFGNIISYDSSKGSGTIAPERGGDALSFRKDDLQQQAQEPLVEQRYRYDTANSDGGRMRAVNLRQQNQSQDNPGQQNESQVRKDQARQQQG